MMRIKILLCDDDEKFLQKLAATICRLPLYKEKSIELTKVTDPLILTDRQLAEYQIMFLDIDMRQRSGMDVARRVRYLHLNTILIFVTNYPQFSMEGYEVRAFRYLLKQEIEQKLSGYFREALAEIPQKDSVFRFSVHGEPYTIPHKAILYLESRQRLINLYALGQRQGKYQFYGKMEDLSRELEKAGFLRVQKSFLVNMQYIRKLKYDGVLLRNGVSLPVSKKRYPVLKVLYLDWMGKQWEEFP